MEVLNTPEEMRRLCRGWSREGRSIGLVPTMGALHEGHLTLARAARKENERFVASIFVNPTQFENQEDFARYARPFERDLELVHEVGCDAVFAPSPEAMYGGEESGDERPSLTFVEIEKLGEVFEGKARPGHFRGVATIVAKLFGIVGPDRAYFGEKDYQQLKIIEQMVRDLFLDVEIISCPTVREADGLAMSSRNVRLSPEEREAALTLSRALRVGVALAEKGERDAARITAEMQSVCEAEPLVEVKYVAVVHAETLEPLAVLDGSPARALVSADVGSTHLIDNVSL
jgi:pantoate--beta-alanine ligase